MPIPPGLTVDVAAINAAMEACAAADTTTALTEEQTAAMQVELGEAVLRVFREDQARERERQVWRPDSNEPGVEIRVCHNAAESRTEIEARFQLRTGEPEQRCRSVVDDLDLDQGVDGDGILNEHIRMTVDRLCAERRRAEFNTFTFNTTTTTTYYWQNYANAFFNTPANANAIVLAGSANLTFGGNSITTLHFAPLTPAQQAEWEAKWKAEEAERTAAEKNAEELLLDVIGRHKYRIWRKQGTVHVSSRKYKGLRYEIKAGEMIKLHQRQGRTWRVRRDKLCIHPLDKHPRGDEVAALYVLARFDEDELWRTGNHHHKDQEPALELAA